MDLVKMAGWTRSFLMDGHAPSTQPILLLLDGHSSHYSPDTIHSTAEEQVIIFALPPHTTDVSQRPRKSSYMLYLL